MNDLENNLNNLLVKVYRSLEKLESGMLRASKNINLSINEIHMLEAIEMSSQEGSASISDISAYLDISLPSVTLAVNKLVSKGYVTKERCGEDGRVVRVVLTREGHRAEHAHRYFHRSMVRSVTKELTETERNALLKGVQKLDDFLDRNIQKYKVMR
ncbi:MAG: MarR family winged helix-turn-helix transcriptional regulator [Oscillospiraceae bacterium]